MAKVTSSSGFFAIARRQAVTARLNPARSALPSIRCEILGWWSFQSLQRLGKPVTLHAAGIAVDRTERFIPVCPVQKSGAWTLIVSR